MPDLDVDRLQESVTNLIATSHYEEALSHIRSFVEQIINDPESVAEVFASREVDALCSKLASAYFGVRGERVRKGKGTVILATELVPAGGHVELIKDYLALNLCERPVRVALSDLFNRMDQRTGDEWQSLLGCEVFIADPDGLEGKLQTLDERLDEWNPSNILTLGHNQDVVCVVAAHYPGVANRYYIHHGDHHLSLGVTCEAFEHVDLHNMAYELCKHEIGVGNQRYWPLSVVRPARNRSGFLKRGALTTSTCGRMSKFVSETYAFSYERAVALILKATRGFHIHIGDLTPEFIQKIHAALDAEDLGRDRFLHIAWVPSLATALVEHEVDVYLTSFPISGGKALIEAMSAGVPVVTHESYRSRYHGSADLAGAASYVWRNYDELVDIFAQWTEPLLIERAQAAVKQFDRYYSKEAFRRAFAHGRGAGSDVPPLRPYVGDRLQRYLDASRSRARRLEPLESENKRALAEWAQLHAAFEAQGAVIANQQRAIRELMQSNESLAQAVEQATRTQNNGVPESHAAIEQPTKHQEARTATPPADGEQQVRDEEALAPTPLAEIEPPAEDHEAAVPMPLTYIGQTTAPREAPTSKLPEEQHAERIVFGGKRARCLKDRAKKILGMIRARDES
ncbi:glycosyltransferase family 4 protein [Caballeronia sp. GAOx1]|uniref:glycosyltransferase family 4 protein n=1 Tax=Caballeronia sp. GAOx1 TaxID=2921761 RepID=UPI00202818BA|nr:glycosyltransferase family 4 protein [Caballeronia sp. GAOx1]